MKILDNKFDMDDKYNIGINEGDCWMAEFMLNDGFMSHEKSIWILNIICHEINDMYTVRIIKLFPEEDKYFVDNDLLHKTTIQKMIYNDKYSKVGEELLKGLEILEDTFNKNIESCRKDYYNGLCGLFDKYKEE